MIMYYLAKFCRICIQTGGKLTDIESTDYDSVRFSEKLKACTQMVITRESLSTQICSSCVHKLRISYQFQNMCKKSTTILQRYLTELLSMSDDIAADKFSLSELHITISTALPKPRRKRVGKDERCSLLKKLLSKITHEQMIHNIHINGLAKLCDRIPPPTVDKQISHVVVPQQSVTDRPDLEILPIPKIERQVQSPQKHKTSKVSSGGGLRNLLNFTRNYNFGYDITSVENHKNFDLTPLEQLAKFTENFFCDHFLDYRETILHISDSLDFDSSDDEEMFQKYEEDEAEDFQEPKVRVKEEIVIVEPDVNLKKEFFDEDEPMYDEDVEGSLTADYDFTSRFVQACYDNSDDIKQECNDNVQQMPKNYVPVTNYVAQNSRLAEIIPITPSMFASHKTGVLHSYLHQPNMSVSVNTSVVPGFLNQNPLHSDFLKQLQSSQETCFKRHRTLSPYSVKCRTRGNPFINPQLKKQFQTRNFKCSTCSRRFKSPGYLKAHCSRLKH